MRGFGIACAPRTEDSGMAGPERPFRAVTATEGRGGAHTAQWQRRYNIEEAECLTDFLMVKLGALQQITGTSVPSEVDRSTSVT